MSAPSRRALLGAATVLPLAAVPALAAGEPNPDARLLALFRTLMRQSAAVDGIVAEGDDLPDGITPASEDQECRLAVAMEDRGAIAQQIAGLRPATAAGFRAKAVVMRLILLEYLDYDVTDASRPDPYAAHPAGCLKRFVWQFTSDLLRLTGGVPA